MSSAETSPPQNEPVPQREKKPQRKRKKIAALLLSLLFAGGMLVSGSHALRTFFELREPYDKETTDRLLQLSERLADVRMSSLAKLDREQTELDAKTTLLETRLAEYQSCRLQELTERAVSDDGLARLFSNDFFETAFQEYLTNLLAAFKNDQQLDSWLFPYYVYTLEFGANRNIRENSNIDMWFYEPPGGAEKFTADLADAQAFGETYEFDLYDLIYRTGRVYLTASDLMNTVFRMPDYVADGAVFVKVYGGNPDPAQMSVPGWTAGEYDTFWRFAERYYYTDQPVWTSYRLSAENFGIDWNRLVDEQSYYDAYVDFMDTIAPGLAVYDMVSYYGCDDAYGGMGFDITGKEAAPTEIARLYLKAHPEELGKMGESSYDETIADTAELLEQLTLEKEELELQRSELSALQDRENQLRANRELLLDKAKTRVSQLIRSLLLLIPLTGLLYSLAVFSLCAFLYLKRSDSRQQQ